MSDLTNKKPSKFATGWLVVLGCMLIQAVPFGVASNIMPQFVPFVIEEYGFAPAGFALIFTIGTVVSAIASPFIGALYNKVPTKIMYLIGCTLSGGAFYAFSFAQELWQFYLIAGVLNVGTAAISSIGVPLLINSWFDENSKGKAMGIAFAGGSIGNIFLQQMVASQLANNGPAASFSYFGIISLAVGLPVTLLMLRSPKNDSEIIRGKATNKEEVKTDADSNWGYTLNEVKSIKFFWVFAAGLFFLGMYVSALAVQYPDYLKRYLEIDPSIVGNVGSIFAVCSLGGNVFGGAIFDKLGPVKGLMVAFVLAAVSCASLIFAGQINELAYVFAALKGLSVFAYMMGPSYLAGTLFGKKEFGSILGIVQIFFAVGFAAGSSVFAAIVGTNNNFTMAWTSVMIYIVLCYGLLIVACNGMAKLNKERKNG